MKDQVVMVVFVLVLGSVLTTALVGVDFYTAPRIEKNRVFRIKSRVLDALDIPYNNKDEVEKQFSEGVETRGIGGKNLYVSQDGNIAFQIAGSGLWGPMSGVLALLPDMDSPTIKGISIIHQEETPGLGGRIAETDYLEKFSGKKILPGLKITLPGKAGAENEVDGVTGATLTSKAFERMINAQAKEYISLLREGS